MDKNFLWKKMCLIFITVAVLLLFAIVWLSWSIYKGFTAQFSPIDGIWYCPELGLEISYEPYGKSFLETTDGKVQCLISYHKQSPRLRVFTAGVANTGNGEVLYNDDLIFDFQYVCLKEDCFIVKDKLEDEYVFLKIG